MPRPRSRRRRVHRGERRRRRREAGKAEERRMTDSEPDDDKVVHLEVPTRTETVWSSDSVDGAQVTVDRVHETGTRYLNIVVLFGDEDSWFSHTRYENDQEAKAIEEARNVHDLLKTLGAYWLRRTMAAEK